MALDGSSRRDCQRATGNEQCATGHAGANWLRMVTDYVGAVDAQRATLLRLQAPTVHAGDAGHATRHVGGFGGSTVTPATTARRRLSWLRFNAQRVTRHASRVVTCCVDSVGNARRASSGARRVTRCRRQQRWSPGHAAVLAALSVSCALRWSRASTVCRSRCSLRRWVWCWCASKLRS